MRLPQNSRAFTLLEVLILATVGALAGGLLVAILVNNSGVIYQQSSRVTQGLNINDALIKIRSLVKESAAVVSEYPEGSSQPTFQTSQNVLVVKLNVLDGSGKIIPNVFDYAVFFKEEDRLRFKMFADPQSGRGSEDAVLASKVTGIIFDYLDANSQIVSPPTMAEKVRATITLQEKAGYSSESNVATSEASLRND